MSKPTGSVWDFEIFKNTATDVEKDRILAIYLNSEVTNTDWDKVASDLKSASANSVKVSNNNTFKKVEKAGGKSGVAAADPSAPKTPTSGKKRKSKAEMEDKDDAETTPKSKKGRKTKKEIAAEAEAKIGGEGGEDGVKEEQNEDEF